MREIVEFRVPEDDAERFLPKNVGVRSGSVRIIKVEVGDPLLDEIKRIDGRLRREEGEGLYTCWEIRRIYSRSELAEAKLFHVWPKRVFEPAGEECGATYDDTKACPLCGAGAPQTSPLFLVGRRIPKKVDFSQTIAGEIVVSVHVFDVFREHELTGVEFEQIRLSNLGGKPSEKYFQLNVTGTPVELDPVTRVGHGPFDEESYGRCPRNDVVGLNLLSEVTVIGKTIGKADVMVTRQMIGVRRGLLRPRPVLLFSSKAWRVIEEAKLRGLVVEVARVS